MLVLLTIRQHLIPYHINRMRNFISLDSSNLTIKTRVNEALTKTGSQGESPRHWLSDILFSFHGLMMIWNVSFDQKISLDFT